MIRVLVFELLLPGEAPLARRVPGEALDALPGAAMLKRRVDPTPLDIDVIKRILDALREW